MRLLASQVDGSVGVVVEHHQVVDASAAIRITSRIGNAVSPPVRAGAGIGMSGLVTAWAAWLSSASVVRTITVTGCPRWDTQLTGGDAGLESEFDAVMAALGAAAVIAHLGDGAVGQVAARTHRGGDGLDIARVSGSIHPDSRDIPSRPCGPSTQAAAPGPVGLVVVAVGVEDLIDTAGDGLDDVGIALGGFAHQAGFHLAAVGHRHAGGQHVDGPADHPQMVLTDHAGLDRLRPLRAVRGAAAGRPVGAAAGSARPVSSGA